MHFAEKGPPSIWPIPGSLERAEPGLAFADISRVEHGPVPALPEVVWLPVRPTNGDGLKTWLAGGPVFDFGWGHATP